MPLADGVTCYAADFPPALAACLAASLLDRQAVGDEAGQAILRLRTGIGAAPKPHGRNCAQLVGFSLHANTRVPAPARAALETLCTYICRPAIARHRIELLEDGQVRVWLKSPWADGTVAKVMAGQDFVVRMGAIVPMPRCPVLRYHGVFGPALTRPICYCPAVVASAKCYPLAAGRGVHDGEASQHGDEKRAAGSATKALGQEHPRGKE